MPIVRKVPTGVRRAPRFRRQPTAAARTQISRLRADDGAVVDQRPARPKVGVARAYTENKQGQAVGEMRTYIEVDNYEVGARLQFINLSANPAASFRNPDDVVTLPPLTGHHLGDRKASFELTAEQLSDLGLQPGDQFRVRAVRSEQASELNWAASKAAQLVAKGVGATNSNGPVDSFEVLRGRERQTIQVSDVVDTRKPVLIAENLQAFSLSVHWRDLDVVGGLLELPVDFYRKENFKRRFWNTPGDLLRLAEDPSIPEGARRAFSALAYDKALRRRILKVVADPSVSLLDDTLFYEVLRQAMKGKTSVVFSGSSFVEPGSRVSVQNQRTGEQVEMTSVPPGSAMMDCVVFDMRVGDPLVVKVIDASGVQSDPSVVVYDPSAKGSVRSGMNLLQLRCQSR